MQVRKIIDSCTAGLRLGSEMLAEASWQVPADDVLRRAVLAVCLGRSLPPAGVSRLSVLSALDLLAPKDKRTLLELCQKGHGGSRPAGHLTRTVPKSHRCTVHVTSARVRPGCCWRARPCCSRASFAATR